MEFHRFDEKSMNMRYPVKKDLFPMNKRKKLDILNLHERMLELRKAFYTLDLDLNNQLFRPVEQEIIDEFLLRFDELYPKVIWILKELKSEVEQESHYESKNVFKILTGEVKDYMESILTSLNDDELIMLDALYYTGRAIICEELRLPCNPHDAKTDVAKFCILNMERDKLEFGKPKNDEINIYGKKAFVIIEYVSKAIEVLRWGKV